MHGIHVYFYVLGEIGVSHIGNITTVLFMRISDYSNVNDAHI